MTLDQINGTELAWLAVPFSAIWGLVCGIFERFLLAPRRRLSSIGPAYFPGMTFGFLGCCAFLMDFEHGIRFVLGPLMGATFFLIGAAPALALFHFSRWMLRTRFSQSEDSIPPVISKNKMDK